MRQTIFSVIRPPCSIFPVISGDPRIERSEPDGVCAPGDARDTVAGKPIVRRVRYPLLGVFIIHGDTTVAAEPDTSAVHTYTAGLIAGETVFGGIRLPS